jgi:hypothetical protein
MYNKLVENHEDRLNFLTSKKDRLGLNLLSIFSFALSIYCPKPITDLLILSIFFPSYISFS